MQSFNYNRFAGPALGIFQCSGRGVQAKNETGLGFMGMPMVQLRGAPRGLGDFLTDVGSFLTNTVDSLTGAGAQKHATDEATRTAEILAQARVAEANARVAEAGQSTQAIIGAAPAIAGAIAVVGVALIAVAYLRK